MDDLSEIHLDFDGKIGLLEELYDSALDHEFTELNVDTNVSRPSSTMSFASWSFSPIAQESIEIEELTDSENSVEQQKTQQTSPQQNGRVCKPAISETTCTDSQNNQACHVTQKKPMMNVANFKQPVNQHIVNQPVCISVPGQPMNNVVPNQYPAHVIQQQNNSAYEFVYPKTFTYHQSVNIHNYVGGQVWRPDCVIERPVIHTSPPPLQQQNIPQELKIEFPDPLANLNSAGLELARCSTPEYLMALHSLNHPDSPPKQDHSSVVNFNCSILDDSVIDKSVNNVRHDSGYISDVAESPVIRLHDGNVKFTHGKQTSTPQPPPPVLRMTNLPNFSKEKPVPMHRHQFIQSPHSMPVFNSRPQSNESNHINPFFHPGSYIQSTLQKPKMEIKPPPQIKTDQPYKNMADYQLSKKVKTVSVKRKIEPETDAKSDNKRRRHNEPLNNKALQVLNEWYDSNSDNPYPNRVEKEDIAKRGGLSVAQVKSWFANKRNRSHNTRPKKQKKEMEGRLLDICHQLARDASRPNKDNAYYIQQLSSIMETTKYL